MFGQTHLRYGLFCGVEFQCCGIDAVAQTHWTGSILEHMAKMAAAFGAQHFGADHAMGDVALFMDMAVDGRLGEARPAAAGLELRI